MLVDVVVFMFMGGTCIGGFDRKRPPLLFNASPYQTLIGGKKTWRFGGIKCGHELYMKDYLLC
jgi:hypothetical protein